MRFFKPHILLIFGFITTVLACSNEPSLQTYYVDNELQPGFSTLDMPLSFLNIEEAELSKEEQEAIDAVDKLNMLSFIINDDNREQYQTELATVKDILEQEDYEELMRGGSSTEGKFKILLEGEEDDLDEIILFGNADDKGFAIVRILGDDMNANHLVKFITTLDKADVSDEKAGQILNFFQMN